MPAFKYLGPTSGDNEILNRLRVQTEISGTVTPATLDAQITSSLSSKADNTYLSNKASQYVATSELTGKGNNYVSKFPINEANTPILLHQGVIPITGIYPNQYERSGGRGWNKPGEWTSANLSITTGAYSSTTEQQIGSFTVNGPSTAWYPVFLGFFTIGLGKGEVCIKKGTRYIARAVSGNDPNTWFTCNICPTESLTTYTGSQSFTITRRAFFSPGSTNVSSIFQFCCVAIPA